MIQIHILKKIIKKIKILNINYTNKYHENIKKWKLISVLIMDTKQSDYLIIFFFYLNIFQILLYNKKVFKISWCGVEHYVTEDRCTSDFKNGWETPRSTNFSSPTLFNSTQ